MARPSYFVLLTAILLPGCGSGPAQRVKDVPVQVPAGWSLVKNDAQGVSLCAPSGWHEGSGVALGLSMPLDSNGSGADSFGTDNPLRAMAGQLDQVERADEERELAKLAAEGKFCHCVDGSRPIPGEQRTRFYVQRIVRNKNANLDEEAEKERANMKGLAQGTAQRVTLPIGPAERLENKIVTIGGDEVYRIAFVMVDARKVYILRFVTTGNAQTIESIADGVAQTLRIKPSA